MTVNAQIGARLEVLAVEIVDAGGGVLALPDAKVAAVLFAYAITHAAEGLALCGMAPERVLEHVGEGYCRGAWRLDPRVDTAALHGAFGG